MSLMTLQKNQMSQMLQRLRLIYRKQIDLGGHPGGRLTTNIYTHLVTGSEGRKWRRRRKSHATTIVIFSDVTMLGFVSFS